MLGLQTHITVPNKYFFFHNIALQTLNEVYKSMDEFLRIGMIHSKKICIVIADKIFSYAS